MKSNFISYLSQKSAVALGAAMLLMAGMAQANILTVTSIADSGPGTLRAALASAANGDTIDATGVAGIILLTSGELSVSSGVTIVGPGAASLSVSQSVSGNVFHVAPGQTASISGLTIAGGSTGVFNQGTVTVTVCIIEDNGTGILSTGPGATVNNCTINNNSSGGIQNNSGTLAVNNCFITGNVADLGGAGIYNDGSGGSASLSINNCTITSNLVIPENADSLFANACGGGVANYALNGVATLTIANSSITGNAIEAINGTATKALGGGVYNGGTATMTLTGDTISNNSANNDFGPGEQTAAGGGGIYNDGSDGGNATLVVTNSTVTGNQAEASNFGRSHGGGIFNDGSNGRATLTVVNSSINTNSTVSSILDTGAGIKNSVDESEEAGGGDASVTLNNCQLIGNSVSKTYGGAIDNQGLSGPNATMDLINCTVDGNVGVIGGAIVNDDGMMTISQSTLANNSATRGFGGGIYNNADSISNAMVFLANSTLSGNKASSSGGGIFNNLGLVMIANSTLSGNTNVQAGGSVIDNESGLIELGSTLLNADLLDISLANDSGTVTSFGFNLSSDSGSGFLTNTADLINTNPKLGPLQNNGGLTFTCALPSNSPAIDQGFNFSGSTNDQRGAGFARTSDNSAIKNAPGGDGTDIGAYEVQQTQTSTPPPPPPPTIDQLVPCDGPASGGKWKSHAQYVETVLVVATDFLKAKRITIKQWEQIVTQAAWSRCGWNPRCDRDNDQDWHRNWNWAHDCNWGR
jgi:fibronectin-binding autotransporter adhesin